MNSKVFEIALIIFALKVFLLLVIMGPFFTIWSIQILFRAETLEANFQSWCAAAWLIILINGLKIVVKKNP